MGKRRDRKRTAIVLSICAVMAAVMSLGGCTAPSANQSGTGTNQGNGSGGQNGTEDSAAAGQEERDQKAQNQDTWDQKTAPAYVYYIKNTDLMRADVNKVMDEGKNPSVVMKGAGPCANLKDYYDVKISEDGSFLIFNFEMESENFSVDEKLIAVNDRDGTAKVLYDGYAYTVMCRNRLLYQVPVKVDLKQQAGQALSSRKPYDISEQKYDLYSYTPQTGSCLEVEDVYNFYPSEDGAVICFTRKGEHGKERLYRYRDGKEEFLADDGQVAGVNGDCSNIYMSGFQEDGDLCYFEMDKINKNGTVEEILSKADRAGSYYLDSGSDRVYYSVYGEDGINSLYYYKEGEKKLLSDQVSMVWEFIEKPHWLAGEAMILYHINESGRSRLFAATDGIVSEFAVPDIRDNWVNDYDWYLAGSEDAVYLSLTKMDDSYQAQQSWIYEFDLKGGLPGQSPKCIANGTELDLVREEQESVFYTDYNTSQDLYCDGVKVLENFSTEGLLKTGQGEYFAFCAKERSAPDLMRITTAGSSKLFLENVVQCESFAGGLLLFSDCRTNYPYLGTLSFYSGPDIKVIDEDVTVFFQHGDDFVDMVPWDWDWNGSSGTQADFADYGGSYDPNQDAMGRAYIDGTTFYHTEYGFCLDLSKGSGPGDHYEINDNDQRVGLICYDGDGNERYGVYIGETPMEMWQFYSDQGNAADFGQWMLEMYDRTIEQYGLKRGNEFCLEKAEDMDFDGQKAMKLVFKTEDGLMTIKSTMFRYFIPDQENERFIELERSFMIESQEDMEAFERLAESLQWTDR